MTHHTINQLKIIREAYDQTVDHHDAGLCDLDFLPEPFKKSAAFKRFQGLINACNSSDPSIRQFLKPRRGQNYLDIGSCINLMGYGLHRWPSLYYGVDVSTRLIRVTDSFVRSNQIDIGGLFAADVSHLPFRNDHFDIAAAIGVFEYYEIEYMQLSLKELHRILKNDGRIVIDMPNERHPDVSTMVEYESYLGRPRERIIPREEVERALADFFIIDDVDDSRIMIQYFLTNRPPA